MNEMTYTQVGDYRIPDIELKNTETKPLGKYGRMRRTFLQENNPMLLEACAGTPKEEIPMMMLRNATKEAGYERELTVLTSTFAAEIIELLK